MKHLPTFRAVSDWETSRTAPCWAECSCGWSSDTLPDQTVAEWVHSQHLVQVGELTAGEVLEDIAAHHRAQPSVLCKFCDERVLWADAGTHAAECVSDAGEQARDWDEAERVGDGRREAG
ncbi:MAG: hypothetical protein Q4F65_12930 [Propionibacteriaceae bacterium]|nr:hypothetical protein [Propionibacteriaceae bacterium]